MESLRKPPYLVRMMKDALRQFFIETLNSRAGIICLFDLHAAVVEVVACAHFLLCAAAITGQSV